MDNVWIIGENGIPKEVLRSMAEGAGVEFFETETEIKPEFAGRFQV